MEIETIKGLMSIGETISVIGILLVIVWWFERRTTRFEKKHDDEMTELRKEHLDIIKGLKDDHQSSLKAQREAHLFEKTEFFNKLNETLVNLAKEIQISNEVRSQISHDIDEMKAYQNEIRREIEFFKQEQNTIKTTLLHNSEILSALLQCDLNGKGVRHEFKRELENPRGF